MPVDKHPDPDGTADDVTVPAASLHGCGCLLRFAVHSTFAGSEETGSGAVETNSLPRGNGPVEMAETRLPRIPLC